MMPPPVLVTVTVAVLLDELHEADTVKIGARGVAVGVIRPVAVPRGVAVLLTPGVVVSSTTGVSAAVVVTGGVRAGRAPALAGLLGVAVGHLARAAHAPSTNMPSKR